MPNIAIQPYQPSNAQEVEQLLEEFIEYFVQIDSLKWVKKQPLYGQNYLEKTLKEIRENNGTFILGKMDNQIVGLGTAIIGQLDANDLLEVAPHKPGRITELFVREAYRGQGIGRKLLKELEDYLKAQGCHTIHIEVFAPNENAHKLYNKLGYTDRNIDVVKMIKPF